jgi:hypothetical protein
LQFEGSRTFLDATGAPIVFKAQLSQGGRHRLGRIGIVFLPSQFSRPRDKSNANHIMDREGLLKGGLNIVGNGIDILSGKIKGVTFYCIVVCGCITYYIIGL